MGHEPAVRGGHLSRTQSGCPLGLWEPAALYLKASGFTAPPDLRHHRVGREMDMKMGKPDFGVSSPGDLTYDHTLPSPSVCQEAGWVRALASIC